MSTVQLLRPAQGFDVRTKSRPSTPRRAHHWVRAEGTKAPHQERLAGGGFAAARLARSVELVGACLVLAIFLAVAVFV